MTEKPKDITTVELSELHKLLDAQEKANSDLNACNKRLARKYKIPNGHGIDITTGAIGAPPAAQ